jgi:uncharacterized membrane protein YgdD (TMEM256/DUF423 family)
MTRTLSRGLIALAALLLALATALGAVASHALDGALDARALHSFETAVQYQFVHALGLLAIAIYGGRPGQSQLWLVPAALLAVGALFFCGGVYTSSLGGPPWIVSLAPVGGVALIVGWLAVAVVACLPAASDRSGDR